MHVVSTRASRTSCRAGILSVVIGVLAFVLVVVGIVYCVARLRKMKKKRVLTTKQNAQNDAAKSLC